MSNKSLFRIKKVFSVAIAAVMFLFCFLPVQTASAADPVGVDGRIIPTSMTGDTSEWVEIAQYGGYALIIRRDPLTSVVTMYRTDNNQVSTYSTSTLRKELNNWYNNKLKSDARLRKFAVMSDAKSNFGYYATSSTSGQSKPNGTAAPKGDDVAFALSFSEALYFCSTQYQYQSGSTTSIKPSPTVAFNNYHKLRPSYAGGGQGDNPTQAFWLRTPGSGKMYVGAVAFQGGAPKEHGLPYTHAEAAGRVNQHTVIGAYGHYRPAMWVGLGLFEDKVAVTYNPNGGEGGVNVVSVSANTYYNIEDQGYSRGGYVPNGWNSKADGTGIPYSNGQSVYMTTALTLYAQWKKVVIPTVKVLYNPNGGEGDVNVVSVNANTYYNIEDQGYTWGGYVPNGWNSKADGTGIQYSNGQSVYMTTDLTLYAQWKKVAPPTVKVLYEPNGGEGASSLKIVPSQSYYTIEDQGYYHRNPEYAFDGWNTNMNGLGTRYSNSDVIYLTKDIVLYAQWKQLPPPDVYVVYYPNGGDGLIKIVPVPKNTYYTIEDQGYKMELFDFANWNTMQNGYGYSYNNGSRIFVAEDVVLYAQWKRKL